MFITFKIQNKSQFLGHYFIIEFEAYDFIELHLELNLSNEFKLF